MSVPLLHRTVASINRIAHLSGEIECWLNEADGTADELSAFVFYQTLLAKTAEFWAAHLLHELDPGSFPRSQGTLEELQAFLETAKEIQLLLGGRFPGNIDVGESLHTLAGYAEQAETIRAQYLAQKQRGDSLISSILDLAEHG